MEIVEVAVEVAVEEQEEESLSAWSSWLFATSREIFENHLNPK